MYVTYATFNYKIKQRAQNKQHDNSFKHDSDSYVTTNLSAKLAMGNKNLQMLKQGTNYQRYARFLHT
jgi:hypothetical protein